MLHAPFHVDVRAAATPQALTAAVVAFNAAHRTHWGLAAQPDGTCQLEDLVTREVKLVDFRAGRTPAATVRRAAELWNAFVATPAARGG